MTIKEYAEEVLKEIAKLVPNATLTIMDVKKNNGIMYTGINIRKKGSNVAPTVYVNWYHEEKVAPAKAAEMMLNVVENAGAPKNSDLEWITNFENVKPFLKAKLINESNKLEVFRSAKEYGFDDLIISPYVRMKVDGCPDGSVTPTNQMLELWGVSADEVIDIALENSAKEAEVSNLYEIIAKMHGCTLEDFGLFSAPPMLLVSTKEQVLGAVSILSKLDYLRETLGDFIVIPSSVHEMIAVEFNPAMDDEYMKAMVNEVNRSVVYDEDILSNNVYRFVKGDNE